MRLEIIDYPPFRGGICGEASKTDEWNRLKQELPFGTVLSGNIFARTLFGVFFDSGHGFPVRMDITDFGKPEGNMKWPDDYPALGSEIKGVFNWFEDSHRQLVVIRMGLKPHFFSLNEVPASHR
ncbi:hypothetical protein Q5H92_12355 [Hymenobacter sp. M29]|uniref:S1 motif domain-containing protein n=1 Tax=Hymenobacter mellowenesis TaxID=3063995 RepID=A0ABT9ABE3_9BACT|nr:hypothetical protein [Hymenobacter sp. M29]MDO7847155.1 hypothetical protein [Hymenobacter sp. M29]